MLGAQRPRLFQVRARLVELEGQLGLEEERRAHAEQLESLQHKLTLQRAKDAAKVGHKPGHESSIFKLVGTELNQRRRDLMCAVLGPQALGWEGDGFEPEELKATRDWLRSRLRWPSA